MQTKIARAVQLSIASILLAACNPYDSSRLNVGGPDDNKDASTDASTSNDAGDAGPCVPKAEICNGKDDDCDMVVDEKAAANAYCEEKAPHSIVTCTPRGICLPTGCATGYKQCDGQPGNGCELKCSAACGFMCEDDAGADDGGTDDGG